MCELLKTRRILKCSYPYGFFLQQGSTQKEIFELMQVIQRLSVAFISPLPREQEFKSPSGELRGLQCPLARSGLNSQTNAQKNKNVDRRNALKVI